MLQCLPLVLHCPCQQALTHVGPTSFLRRQRHLLEIEILCSSGPSGAPGFGRPPLWGPPPHLSSLPLSLPPGCSNLHLALIPTNLPHRHCYLQSLKSMGRGTGLYTGLESRDDGYGISGDCWPGRPCTASLALTSSRKSFCPTP